MGPIRELSLGKVQDENFDEFKLLINNLLQSHVFMKEKCVRGNKVLSMNKSILKAIMACTRLLNRFRKEITLLNQLVYKRQFFLLRFLKRRNGTSTITST